MLYQSPPFFPFPPRGILPSYICPTVEWRWGENFHFGGYSSLFFPFLASTFLVHPFPSPPPETEITILFPFPFLVTSPFGSVPLSSFFSSLPSGVNHCILPQRKETKKESFLSQPSLSRSACRRPRKTKELIVIRGWEKTD